MAESTYWLNIAQQLWCLPCTSICTTRFTYNPYIDMPSLDTDMLCLVTLYYNLRQYDQTRTFKYSCINKNVFQLLSTRHINVYTNVVCACCLSSLSYFFFSSECVSSLSPLSLSLCEYLCVSVCACVSLSPPILCLRSQGHKSAGCCNRSTVNTTREM